MSSLESYIFKKYGRFVPFKDCSDELLFDVALCLDASLRKDCTGGTTHKANYYGEVTYGLAAEMIPAKYTTERFCIANENIDFKNNGLLFSVLARLLNLNMHYQGEQDA